MPDAYAVVPEGANLPMVLNALEALRADGVAVQLHAGGGSMKSQFKRANASGARFALVFGADELARGEVGVKDLRAADVAQVSRTLAQVGQWAAQLTRTA